MSLTQDEVSTLLSGDEAEIVEIMSPEEIEAMLENSAGDESGSVDSLADDDLDDHFDRLAEEGTPAAEVSDADIVPSISTEGLLTPQEIDILGEIGNISMGAVATTMYSLLDRKVSITTPRVTIFDVKNVLSVYRIPFVVATIEYVEGITGNNLLVLKVDDAAMITDILMGGTGVVETPAELTELHLSAMSEIMNQMMGASSTSLSKLLQKPINISPPTSSQVDVGFDVTKLLGDIDMVTKISFDMEIEGLLKSELIQLMPYDVSRDFTKQFMDVEIGLPSEESNRKTDEAKAPPPAPEPPSPASEPPAPAFPPPQMASPPRSPSQETVQPEQSAIPDQSQMQQTEQNPGSPYPQDPYSRQWPYPQAPYPQTPYQQTPYLRAPYTGEQPSASGYPQAGRLVDVHPVQFQAFDAPNAPAEQRGIDLVYNIPLQVTVELGKTKKEIAEILEFGSGSIVVLDKIAGDPVEIVVNGKLIARGEVVVIDENYGVRITDIVA